MRIDFLLVFSFVEIFEFHANVVSGLLKCIGTWRTNNSMINKLLNERLDYITSIFWEAYRQGRSLDFLLEQIFLVQEKYYGRFHKPFGVAN